MRFSGKQQSTNSPFLLARSASVPGCPLGNQVDFGSSEEVEVKG